LHFLHLASSFFPMPDFFLSAKIFGEFKQHEQTYSLKELDISYKILY